MSSSGEKKLPKNEILNELVSKQLNDIPTEKCLTFSDLKRVSKYLDSSIFQEDRCCLWKGYVTNSNNEVKGTYINFYFRNKKVALHRLLYCNFVSVLGDDEYLKFSCENKGSCCCIHHLKKFKYQKKSKPRTATQSAQKEPELLPAELRTPKEVEKALHIEFD